MRDRRFWVMVMGVFVFGVFVFSLVNVGMRFTGFAVYTDIGGGRTNLILQDAGTDNLGDVYVEKGTGNRNHGDKDELKVQRLSWQRSYLSFNISAVPVGQVIDDARLCLFLDNDQGFQTISINHVYDDDWCEGDGGTDASPACEMTWNNQPCGVDEEVIGGSCNASVEDVLVTDTGLDDTWQCFNVTEMMRGDYGDGEISMVLWTVDSGGADIFASKEDVNVSRYPYLNITYHSANVAPVVGLVSPVDGNMYVNVSLSLDYNVVDSNLDSCWYSLDGVNVSLPGCLNISFDVGGSGDYVLVVYANDSFGEEGVDSVSFSVDVEGVGVDVVEPVGEKDSRTDIEIVYSVSGADDCWYNVETSIRGSVIENTSLENCSGSSFDVSADGDFVLNLFVNNSYGSFGSDSSNFSVDSSIIVVVSPPSGGGGGGGGSYVISSSVKLEIDKVDVIVSRGEEKSLLVGVKNVGRISANKCSLVGGDFVDSSDIFNIGVGEIVEFRFVLRALDGVEDLELVVKCLDNVSGVVPLSVEVLKPSLDVLILGIGFDSGELRIDYSVEPSGDSVSVLYFRILDSDGNVVSESVESVELVLGEGYEGVVMMDVRDVGEGMLRVVVSDGDVSFVEEDFVYGGVGMTGFASLDWVGDFSYIGIILVVFLVLAGLLVRRIWKLRKIRKG